MIINKTTEGSTLTLAPAGRLDTLTSQMLEDEINKSITDADELILDLCGLDYISSAGLRVLLSAHKKMSAKGGMKVCGVSDMIADIFEVTGFDTIFDIQKD